jgi:uncharacterized protein (TIGR03000 family)
MVGKRLVAVGVVVAAALAPAAARAQCPSDCRMLPGGYWQYPNVHWPSDVLYFTGTGGHGNYRVHYPGGGGDTYRVTPADIAWVNDRRVAVIEVELPQDDALVTVNGEPQAQVGPSRRYATPPLEPGQSVYEITAEWRDRDDKPVKDERVVRVSPGDRVLVDFTKPAPK